MTDEVSAGATPPPTPPAPPPRRGPGLAGLALAVGIAALTASAFLLGVFVGAGREARRSSPAERPGSAAEARPLAALVAVTPAPATPTPTPGRSAPAQPAPSPAPTPTPRPSPSPSPASAPTPAVTVASATAPVRLGGMQLRIVSAQVGQTPLQEKMFGEQLYTPETNLGIQVELTNTSSTWKTDYTTWVDASGSRKDSTATLRDNFGNHYYPVAFKTIKPVGKTGAASLYPGQTINDFLVFERPIAAVRSLTLELPAANFGGQGLLRLQIPASMIKGLK